MQAEIEAAAKLCYADDLSNAAIARELGIGVRTLGRWKHRADFCQFYEKAHADDRECYVV